MMERLFPRRRRRTVQMMQLNSAYGNKLYLPYSAGMLKSYACRFPEIRAAYDFAPFLPRREPVEALVERIGAPDVFCISGYVWNWRLSMAVAEALRARDEDCLIVVGGPHVPNLLEDFFERHPYLDIACQGEGEVTFHEILARRAAGESLCDIPGTAHHDRGTGRVNQNPRRDRIQDLDVLPSPYLDGTFDHLLKGGGGFEWMAMWETNRGCPYSCTFCDWGSATATKVRAFGADRLYREIDWFGENGIRWVFGCDANFGILKRDEDLADALVRTKERTGYPEVFRVCYAKNSDEKVYRIATTLNEAHMAKGISLSMQSLNKETLKRIKRGNIKLETFHKLQARYMEEDISTFTELIIALPGETYESFKDGIDKLLDNGQHSQINIYNCSVMPNAEMGDPAYRRAHKIRAVEIPIFQPHAAPDERETVQEYEPIVVSTATLPVEDWRRTYHFAWAVQCLHLLNVFKPSAVLFRNRFGIQYSEFYEAVLQYGHGHPGSIVAEELRTLDGVLDNVLSGVGFDQYLPRFSDITWPPEEASFLRLSERLEALYAEFGGFLEGLIRERGIEVDSRTLRDLLRYQRATLVHYDAPGDVDLELGCNLHEYLTACMLNRPAELEKGEFSYRVVDHLGLRGDKRRFATEVVWYGRKGGKYAFPVRPLHSEAMIA